MRHATMKLLVASQSTSYLPLFCLLASFHNAWSSVGWCRRISEEVTGAWPSLGHRHVYHGLVDVQSGRTQCSACPVLRAQQSHPYDEGSNESVDQGVAPMTRMQIIP